jgi:spore germination protein YaaH
MKMAVWAGLAAVLLATGAEIRAAEGIVLHGWIVEWDAPAGLEALRAHSHRYDGISIFGYQFDDRGNLVPANPELPALTRKIRQEAPQTPLTLTVVNDVGNKYKDNEFIRRLLSSPSMRRRHIEQLVDLSREYDGLEIDYENYRQDSDLRDRKNFSDFIAELKRRLPTGKKLTVDVETDPLVLDWKAISGAADGLNVMAYFSHWTGSGPGALCEFSLLEKIARDISRQGVSPSQILVILPTHGFDWPQGKSGKQMEHEEAEALRRREGSPPLQRDAEMNPYFTYTSKGKNHTVFYEDTLSLQRKVDKLRELGLTHIGLWRLGKGPADI